MALSDFAKQAGNQIKNKIKAHLKKILLPILIKYGIPALLILIILFAIIGIFMGDGADADAAEDMVGGEPTGWWWPIGSSETTTENGKLFASGDPELGKEKVSRVGDNGASEWGITVNAHGGNLGLDIAANSQSNKYYVISIGNGTVKYVADGVSEGRSNANGGCGNYVEIDYGEIIVRFLHLYAGSIKVSVGDSVTYGQVIGKIGHNGDSTGPHCHMDIRPESALQGWKDPVNYVDPNDPRPMTEGSYGSGSDSALTAYLKNWENLTVKNYIDGVTTDYNSYVKKYITQDRTKYIMHDDGYNTRNYGYGICIWYSGNWNNVDNFKKEGINITDAKYNQYGVSKISVDIVDRVMQAEIESKRTIAKNMIKKRGIKLTDYQLDAITACLYQGTSTMGDFLDAYKNYGMDPQIRSYCKRMNENCIPAKRGDANWTLFSTGKYIGQDGKEIKVTSNSSGGKIIEVADRIHTYIEKNGYVYYSDEGISTTFEKSKRNKKVCCATFVSWVLQDAGYISESEHTDSSKKIKELLIGKGWTQITNISKAKAGDVLYYLPGVAGKYGHSEIYAGNNKVYNCGGSYSINRHLSNISASNPSTILRAPNKN